MENIKKIIPFVKPYKHNVVWNIIYNILYAIFSTLSFVALIPMMQVLFNNAEKVTKKPVFESIWKVSSFGKDYLYYSITKLTDTEGPEYALLLAVVLIIITFLLKNIFNYLASYHLMHLRNGVLKDMRIQLFNKIISLPIGFYSEKRKSLCKKAHFPDWWCVRF